MHICHEEIFTFFWILSFFGVWGYWLRTKIVEFYGRFFESHRHSSKCDHESKK